MITRFQKPLLPPDLDYQPARRRIHQGRRGLALGQPGKALSRLHPGLGCELPWPLSARGFKVLVEQSSALFCFEHAGVRPDIMTLGKGIWAGVPLAAALAREEVCRFEPGEQGGTYNGNAQMVAVAAAVVLAEVTASPFLTHVNAALERLWSGLEALLVQHELGPVRGKGLLLALDLGGGNAGVILDKALELRLLLNAPRPDSLRFMPALNVSFAEIDQMLEILDDVLSQNQGVAGRPR